MKINEILNESNPLLGYGNHPQDPAWKRDEAMPSVETYSPLELAKKHGVTLDQIMKELRLGTEIETEHTIDRNQAMEIALDHLLELPDYYTRLDKMERDAEVTETFSDSKLRNLPGANRNRETSGTDSEKGDLVKITPKGVKVRGSMQYLGVGDWVEIRETGFQQKIIHLSKHSIRLEDGKYYSLTKLKYPMD